MERITIYPKNEKQQSLLTSLLKEMKVRFEIEYTPEAEADIKKHKNREIEKLY